MATQEAARRTFQIVVAAVKQGERLGIGKGGFLLSCEMQLALGCSNAAVEGLQSAAALDLSHRNGMGAI